jgi:hypothetical protein
MGIIQYAILNDIHFPYEARAFYDALDLIKGWPNLKHIYLNGDCMEVESLSSHPKHPIHNKFFNQEIEYANTKFDLIQRKFKNMPVTLIEGNHCFRYFRFIRDVAPEMWGLIQFPSLLQFEKRKNWIFIPYGPTQWVKCGNTRDLWLRHEPLVGGANHAKGTAEKSYVSVIYGHTHQVQQYTVKKSGPEPYHVTAYSGGWLGDISKPCFDYRGAKDNWMLGFTRIDCNDETNEYEVRFIRM